MSQPSTSRGVVLVTGGASGIGLATAERLIAENWRVAIADRDTAALSRSQDAFAAVAERLAFLTLDVTDEAAVDAAVAEAAAAGPLAGLVNSAGIAQNTPFLDIEAADFRRILDVNLTGSFLVARAVARGMRDAGTGGAIVNIASISGIRGSINRAAYGASKGGVITLTKVMATELAAHGIRVNAVAPGPVDTPLVQAVHPPEIRELYRRTVPQRRYGLPEEMASMVAFLLDPERAGYVTGQVIAVDGGFTAAGLMSPE